MKDFKSVTLEMSLKPFKKTDEAYMTGVIERAFSQWHILTDGVEEVSVLLWISDGSEILEWNGDYDTEIEWGHYIGGANNTKGWNKEIDPDRVSLHSRYYEYLEARPTFTYGTVKRIVELIKEIGNRTNSGKNVRVGATFDPGPEFAKSKFKYENHRECCRGGAIGAKSFVCSYSTLHADDFHYAGFPDGIPEGLDFGTFLGRQSQHFLSDMGFDYLWLSNGFGFGTEPWSAIGAIFDGEKFNASGFEEIKKNVLNFWTLFRKECPDYRIEARGTNFSVGIDLATDGVPLKAIYESNFNLLPPPNSPWAAIDSNFGLELVGYMSRIAEIPDDRYLFRYYVHDPWWANSPWNDRYEGLPHDIYLPMAVCRLDDTGKAMLPSNINILSIDNSWGDMPDFCAYEPSIYIKKALRYAPDSAPPVLWVYPFSEYHNRKDERGINEMFFEDWFMIGALNHGFPVSGVISTDGFYKSYNTDKSIYDRSVIVSVIPDAGSEYETALIKFIGDGGKVIFYGSADRASDAIRDIINVTVEGEDSAGEMTVMTVSEFDTIIDGEKSDKIIHRTVTSGRGYNTKIKDERCDVKAIAYADGKACAVASDKIAWVGGTCSAAFLGGNLFTPDNEKEYFSGESLMRYALSHLGYDIEFEKQTADSKEPVIMLSRHDNAVMVSVCAADTTVKTRMKFPLGAPLLCGREAKITSDGYAEYVFNKADFAECRVFIEQEEGVVGCHEIAPGSWYMERRIKLSGLKNATVRFIAPEHCKNNIDAIANSQVDFYQVGTPFESGYGEKNGEVYFEARNLTGELILSIPFEEQKKPCAL